MLNFSIIRYVTNASNIAVNTPIKSSEKQEKDLEKQCKKGKLTFWTARAYSIYMPKLMGLRSLASQLQVTN